MRTAPNLRLLQAVILVSLGCDVQIDAPIDTNIEVPPIGGGTAGGTAGGSAGGAGADGPGSGPNTGGPGPGDFSCVPTTCEAAGKDCGPIADGCGQLIECGQCEAPQTCGGGGEPSVCGGKQACVPLTCAELGKDCGPIADGCGDLVDCGTCSVEGDTCGGGGQANVCGQPQEDPDNCVALLTCADHNLDCGLASNGCGGVLDCGSCGAGTTCGGGGTHGVCGAPTCTPLTCADYPADHCGLTPNGCGGVLTGCGVVCELPQTCGGSGVHNRCGYDEPVVCVPATSDTLCGPSACGPKADGCGGTAHCGGCTGSFTCGGGGTPGVCGAPECIPRTCAQMNANCGVIPNGCGSSLDCGGCQAGDTCGGGGTPNQCGRPTCTPLSCADQNIGCGPAGNGCGDTIASCGSCQGGATCGGLEPNQCGAPECTARTCEDVGANCGSIGDGCGGIVASCGTCTAPAICGGGGPNQCGMGSGGGSGGADGGVGDDCTGLCEHQIGCVGGAATTLTGTVYAPNGETPLYNAVVYVPVDPDATLPAITDGAACDRCELEDLGDPLVSTLSGSDGSFELRHVPAGVDFPLVIKMGKWRRRVMISAMDACTTVALTDPELTRLPKNSSEGNIPKIAISTGRVDGLECVLYKAGVEASEFTRPTGSGRIHLYRASTDSSSNGRGGAWPDSAARSCQACSGWNASSCRNTHCGGSSSSFQTNTMASIHAERLYEDQAVLNSYDMVAFGCEASATTRGSSDRTRMRNYVDQGGRLFLSHFNYDWIHTTSPLQDTANWGGTAAYWGNQGATPAWIDVDFPRGLAFSEWLHTQGASYSGDPQQIYIHEPRGYAASVTSASRRWIHTTVADHESASVQHFTFNTPVHEPEEEQCGRVVYTAFHVTTGTQWNNVFPNHCGDPLTAQEKALLFMFFDLAACVSDDNAEPPPPPSCTPRECGDAHAECGMASDGCGDILDCPSCPDGLACVNNACVSGCTPRTCAQAGANCGAVADGCGGVLSCGTCPSEQLCGGGGVPNVCGFPACVPHTCESMNASCGIITSGCDDASVDCGVCPDGQACGGDGVPYECGDGDCDPLTCVEAEANCGSIGDGCGGIVDCGTCPDPTTCGGGGVPNQCGGNVCSGLTCGDLNANCGLVGDGCGGAMDCGSCPSGQICGGGGVPNQCSDGCVPLTCQAVGAQCGAIGNGCGGTVQCSSCPAGQTCGGGGVANQCGSGTCTPQTCATVGAQCGTIGNGCGGTLNCGSCPEPLTCGGGGVLYECGGCVPRTCQQAGAECGPVADGCGGLVDCGTCTSGKICGLNAANQCGGIG